MRELIGTGFASLYLGKLRLPSACHLHVGDCHVLHHGMKGESLFRRHEFLLLAHHVLTSEQGLDDGGTGGWCANAAVLHCLTHGLVLDVLAGGLHGSKQCRFCVQRLWLGLALRDVAACHIDTLFFLPVGDDLLLNFIVRRVCVPDLLAVPFLE